MHHKTLNIVLHFRNFTTKSLARLEQKPLVVWYYLFKVGVSHDTGNLSGKVASARVGGPE